MKNSSFFSGPIISEDDGLWGDGWITWFLVVHFLSGFGLYRTGLMIYPRNKWKAFMFAVLMHLVYEIKDIAAYYEHPLFTSWNDWQYNVIPRTFLSSDSFYESDPSHNYPMNSVLDQVLSMLGMWISYKYIKNVNVLNGLTVLWLISLASFNMIKMNVLRRREGNNKISV